MDLIFLTTKKTARIETGIWRSETVERRVVDISFRKQRKIL